MFNHPVVADSLRPRGLQCRRPKVSPWVGKIPWRREWLPTLVFLPAEFHVQSSMVGYNPWCHKQPYTTEWLTLLLTTYKQDHLFSHLFEIPILSSLQIDCYLLFKMLKFFKFSKCLSLKLFFLFHEMY